MSTLRIRVQPFALCLAGLLAQSCAASPPPPSPPSPPASAAVATIAGRVLTADQQPAVGVYVVANPADPNWDPGAGATPAAAARSDAAGRFSLSVPPGSYTLAAHAAQMGTAFQTQVTATLTAAAEAKLVLSAPKTPLRLTVRDAGGNSIAGATAFICRTSDDAGDCIAEPLDAQGRGALGLGTNERWQSVIVQARGFQTRSASLTKADANGEIALQLQPPMAPPGPPPPEVVAWIRSAAKPLATAEPGAPLDDLAALAPALASRQVVAMGEATHGTHEFFTLKRRMFELLVRDFGFTTFAIEANHGEAERVDAYVREGKGSAAEALAGLYFWVWDTEEVLGLIEWMRSYNRTAPAGRKLRFYGFDMQYTPASFAAVTEYLADVDPPLGRDVERDLAPLRQKDTAPAYATKERADATHAAIQHLARALDDHRAAYVGKRGEPAFRRARRHAEILKQADALIRADHDSAVRDRAMADNLGWLLEDDPQARVFVWAHNDHISRGCAIDRYGAMGSWLARSLGEKYYAVAQFFGAGSFQANEIPAPGAKRRGVVSFDVGPSPEGTIDATLGASGLPLFALDLRQSMPASVSAWWRDRHLARQIGAAYGESVAKGFIRPSCAASEFDAVTFVAKATATHPTPTGRRPAPP